MPFLFIIVGAVMLVSAVRGTNDELLTLVKGDFTGPHNFIYWLLAMLILGGLGYIGPIRSLSRYLMALVLIVLILKNGGVAQQFLAAINGTQTNPQPQNAALSLQPTGTLL